MAKRLTNNVITGSDKRLGLYFYYSPVFGHNIIRKTTSLTGVRVKTENAFKGFRESSNRMKQASPIAASLYKRIPAENKQYAIYRLLTSEALKMLKAGLDTGIIMETLNRTYIEPLIMPGRTRKIRRYRLLQHVGQTTEFQTVREFSIQKDGIESTRLKTVSHNQGINKKASNTKEKIPGLIYLGRLPECKNLKMWIRSSDFPAAKG